MFAGVAERQTRTVQVRVVAILCGFKSHLLHSNTKRVDILSTLFCIRSRAFFEPMVQSLRSASVGAKQTSPGRLAPHLLHNYFKAVNTVEMLYLPYFFAFWCVTLFLGAYAMKFQIYPVFKNIY